MFDFILVCLNQTKHYPVSDIFYWNQKIDFHIISQAGLKVATIEIQWNENYWLEQNI